MLTFISIDSCKSPMDTKMGSRRRTTKILWLTEIKQKYLHRQGRNSSPSQGKGHPTPIPSQATEARVVNTHDPTHGWAGAAERQGLSQGKTSMKSC